MRYTEKKQEQVVIWQIQYKHCASNHQKSTDNWNHKDMSHDLKGKHENNENKMGPGQISEELHYMYCGLKHKKCENVAHSSLFSSVI